MEISSIKEQGTGEQNRLFQLAIDTMLRSATAWKQTDQHATYNTPKTAPTFLR
jgi:hypothetical protein